MPTTDPANRFLDFFSHTITEGTVYFSEGRVKAMIEYPEPRTEKQVKLFLGLARILRKFIHNYDMEVKHRDSVTMRHVVALSRVASVRVIRNSMVDRI